MTIQLLRKSVLIDTLSRGVKGHLNDFQSVLQLVLLVLYMLNPSAVADNRISRRISVRRKSAEKIPASRNLFLA